MQTKPCTIKYFGATPTKQVKDLHDKNFKALKKKKLKETLEDGTITHAQGTIGLT